MTKVPLSEVATIERDSIDPARIVSGTVYVGLEHIGSDGSFLNVGTVSAGQLESNKFQFSERHILYGKLRPYLSKIARPSFSGVCSTDILPILPSSKIDRDYLCHFLRQPEIIALATSRSTGANLPRLSPKALANFEVPLPPLPEQRRIAAILDKADEVRAKRRAALAQLQGLTQAIFVEMFGDPVMNPKRWQRKPLGDVLESIDSGQSPICLDRPVTEDEWGVLKLGSVTWCEYDPTQNKALPKSAVPDPTIEVKAGDLLFTRKNTHELVAAAALVESTPPRLMLPDLIFRLRLRADAHVEPRFLHQLVIYPTKRRSIQALAGGTAGSMPNIAKSKLREVPVELPPQPLQREFAARTARVEEQKRQVRVSVVKMDALFDSLQHRAFNGDL